MLKAWKWDYIFLLGALSNSCAFLSCFSSLFLRTSFYIEFPCHRSVWPANGLFYARLDLLLFMISPWVWSRFLLSIVTVWSPNGSGVLTSYHLPLSYTSLFSFIPHILHNLVLFDFHHPLDTFHYLTYNTNTDFSFAHTSNSHAFHCHT